MEDKKIQLMERSIITGLTKIPTNIYILFSITLRLSFMHLFTREDFPFLQSIFQSKSSSYE